MSSGEHPHLNELSKLQFLVIDEADRMIKQGSFPQLSQISEAINRANPPLVDDEDDSDSDESDDEDRLKSLHGIRGEAKVTMLDDRILEMIELQKKDVDVEKNDKTNMTSTVLPEPMEMDDGEYLKEQARIQNEADKLNDNNESDEDDNEEEEQEEQVYRQTFVFSATLALLPSSHYQLKSKSSQPKKNGNKGRRNNDKSNSVEGAIAEILEKANAQGLTKVVDLTSSETDGNIIADAPANKQNKKKEPKKADIKSKNISTKLPPGLSLYQINCTQRHKDSHLYAFLTTTKIGSSGPCLVFCNSIAAVKRVGEMLKVLGLPVRTLHAQMQQKTRMKAVESLLPKQNTSSRSILIATDVAARGLDISSITTVVHYDVARAIDTFIHRSGRTARGMGKTAVGSSISLVSAAEEKPHQIICEAIGTSKSLLNMPVDGMLLSSAQERVALATKIVSCDQAESQTNRQNQWVANAAEDAGLDLDDDLLEGGLMSGNKRERQQFLEAKRAKDKLRQLLAVPMRKQAFGKFLSGVGLQEAIKAEKEVTPFIVQPKRKSNKTQTKKRRRLH